MLTKLLATIFVFSNPYLWLGGVGPSISSPLATDVTVSFDSVDSVPANKNIIKEVTSFSLGSVSNPNFLPIRNFDISEPKLTAKSVLVSLVEKRNGNFIISKNLYEKEADRVLPIASLTKIMTALVTLNELEDLKKEISIDENAIQGYGEMGDLVLDEKLSLENLLYAMLMESSNDAALALAGAVSRETKEDFIVLMNHKAQSLGMNNTYFVDPSGIGVGNISTVRDMKILIQETFSKPFIWDIMGTSIKSVDVFSNGYNLHHYWKNTNRILGLKDGVIGGKTGYTEEAKQCFVALSEYKDDYYLMTILLGSDARFSETKKIIRWTKEAYVW